MTPQELKASILQLAIQGKLVEQRPEEGTAAELVEKIAHAETRRRGGKLGEGKDGLKHLPKAALTLRGTLSALSASPREEIPDSEKPFDIPESWVWVRLGELFQHNTGKALNSADKSGTPLEYITTSNVYWNRFDLGKLKTMCFTDAEVEKCTVQKGDLLVLEGGDIGRAAIWNYDFPMRIQNHIHRLRPYGEVCIEYFYHVFYYLKSVGSINGKGIGIKGLSANVLHSLLIPLPPLAEQKRIVAKIEELLPYIDRYEKAWSKLEDFNKRFPGDMQKSLLQMAIQGKLVDQRPEEGTGEELYRQIQSEKQRLIKSGKIKKEKPLPEITPDEIPFDIPESWKWVRLGRMLETVTSGSRDWAQFYSATGDKFLRMGNLSRNSFDMRLDKVQHVKLPEKIEGQRTSLQAGDLLFSITGEVGTLGLIPECFGKAYINQHTAMLRFLGTVRNKYVPYLMLTDYAHKYYEGNQHGIKNSFRLENISSMPIPLPPLAEQKRIVAKLEELLPLCERLK